MELNKFLESLETMNVNEISTRILEHVFETNYSKKFIRVSPRVLQNWFENDLLPYDRLDGKKHRFNFVEIIWLHIVTELRQIGLPIGAIKNVKNKLLTQFHFTEWTDNMKPEDALAFVLEFNALSKEDQQKLLKWLKDKKKGKVEADAEELVPLTFAHFNEFMLMLIMIILGGGNTFLVIDKFGFTTDYSSDDSKDFLKRLAAGPGTVIPIHKFFYRFVSDPRNIDFLSSSGLLNDEELFILDLIRKGKANSITIYFKEGEPERLTIEELKKVDGNARLVEIMGNKGYRELKTTTEKGVFQVSNIKTKIKLK
ncbi:MAG: helix-turn-helix domain-containing protein [Bacteroidales bacterium]|nr:helix-turn-helix domain-containing protein [Bacteroidales bacterium]